MKHILPSTRNFLSAAALCQKLLSAITAMLFIYGIVQGVNRPMPANGIFNKPRKGATVIIADRIKPKKSVDIGSPSLSYNNPPVYTTGVSIPNLTPTSSGVASPAYSSALTLVGGSSTFSRPRGLATDVNGDLFIADFNNNAVYKILGGTVTPVAIGTGFNKPWGVAVDAAGDVYVSDYGNNAIKKILAGSNTTVTVTTAITNPCGLALDAYGNLFVADNANNSIDKIPAGGGAPFVFASDLSSPLAVAVDGSGNVFVGLTAVGPIKEIQANGDPMVSLGSGFNGVYGIAPDNSGNVFVADSFDGTIKEIPPGGAPMITIATTLSNPDGLAIDLVGRIVVSGYNNSTVNEIYPVGGFYAYPYLPAGLRLDPATGIISGTPTTVTAQKSYTILGYNTSGGTPAFVTMSVQAPPPTLSYSTPQKYLIGTAIQSLSPTGSPASAPGYDTAATAVLKLTHP